MVQSNEDVRIWAYEMSEMRLKWFNQKKENYECPLTFLWILSLQSQNSKESTKKTPAFQHHIHKKLSLHVFMAAYKNIVW